MRSSENVIMQSVIGVVVFICVLITGGIIAAEYSSKANERIKKVINVHHTGKDVYCQVKNEIITIDNTYAFDNNSSSFTKGKKIVTTSNCYLTKDM